MKNRTGKIIGKKRKITLSVFVFLSFVMLIIIFIADIRGEYYNSSVPEIAKTKNVYDTTLLVVADQDYYPYSYYDAKGNVSGYDVELISIIADRLHMNLDVRLLTREAIYKRINDDLADVVLSCDYESNNINEINLLKTQPVEICEFAAFGKEPIHSFGDLYGKKIAYQNDGNVRDLMDKYNLLEYSYIYHSNLDAFTAVENDECDFVVTRFPVGSYVVSSNKFADIKPFALLGSSDMCFGVSSKKTELKANIDECISQLKTDGVLKELNKKWIAVNRISLSLDEYLQQNSWLAVFPCIILLITLIAILLESDHSKVYQKKDIIIKQLTRGYSAAFIVNPETEEIDFLSGLTFRHYNLRPERGVSYSKWLEKNVQNFIYEKDKEYVINEFTKENLLLKLSQDDHYEVYFRVNYKKTYLYFEADISLFLDSNEKQMMLFRFKNKDAEMRQNIQHADELEQALKLAQAGNEAKNRFLFNISHDVRTPLNILQGYTEIAERSIDDRRVVQESIGKIKQTIQYLIQFMNDVLEISKNETGKLRLNLSAVDLIASETDVCNLMTGIFREKQLTFKTDFSGVTDRFVWCDTLRLNRIMSNMFTNAVKFTSPGGTVKYSIKQVPCEKENYASYIFTVKDTGCGMSKEFLEHVYETFERENTSTVTGYSGAGLGMSVVKRLVDLLKGTIEIDSELNAGTTVRIKLDLMLSSEDEIKEKIIRYENAGANLQDMSILLVEDNECNREIAKLVLEDAGVSVEEACDGREAVEIISTADSGMFDAILMDIQMPFLNGYEVAKKIRSLENSEIAQIPIIALTANTFEEDRKKAFDSGMNAFIEKPINIKKLIETLNQFRKPDE